MTAFLSCLFITLSIPFKFACGSFPERGVQQAEILIGAIKRILRQ
jgi:hypothetical protein